MGLWAWIVDRVTEYDTGTEPGRDGKGSDLSAVSRATPVAVLDAPDETARDAEEQPVEKWWAPEGVTLTEPPEPARPELSTEARALENLLISHFDGHNLTLPPLLHVAERVRSQLSNPKFNLGAMAKDLAEDQVIAAAVLRMANSPLYRGLNKITALQPAVSRLGVRALSTLLMHESLRAAMFFRKGRANELAGIVWRGSLASACIMRGLCEFTRLDSEDAFLVGLLHDIGNVVVLRITYAEKGFPQYEIDLDTFEYLCLECHQEFGELLADAWSLPPDLKAIISNHHDSPGPEDPLRTLRLQVQLTDMINAMLGYATPAQYDLLGSRPVRDLGLADRDDFVTFLERLPDEVDETVASL